MRQVKILSAAVAVASTVMSGAIYAQGAGALEEIVVTAQKREQSLQDTPIAIAAFDGNAIEQRGITDINDIGVMVPNVKMTPSPSNSTATTIAIRGSVTINPAISWEPTVGIYMDGVFIGKNLGGIFDVAELERVEVLRGPQGTLYGKNTVGGAVNLITRRPTGEFGGRVTVGLGNYDLRTGYAAVDLPAFDLGEAGRLSTKVILSERKRDGFYDNVADTTGNPLANPPSSSELSNMDRRVGRFDALWEVNDRFDLRYTFDYSKIDQKPVKQQLTYINPDDPFGTGGALPALLAPYLTGENQNRSRTSSDGSEYEFSRSRSHTLVADYDLGSLGFLGDVGVKYLGNWRQLDWADDIDIDGSPLDIFSSERDIDYKQRSHEIQVTGTTERTNYVVGVYYFEEKADVFNPISFFGAFGAPTDNNEYGFDNKTYAVYGQIDWRPSAAVLQDRLTLTAGLRWTREEKDAYRNNETDLGEISPGVPVDPDIVAFELEADDKFSNLSPTFIAAWDVNDNINVYGKVAYGWKSGGFNGESTSPNEFGGGYDEEEIRSVEFGMKSRFLDNRLQINAAVFQNDSKDMQMSIFLSGPGAASVVENAGKARVRGFELEVVGAPSANLQLGLNYGYLDAKYREFIVDGVDERGDKDFPYTPRHSASAFAEYTFFTREWGELTGYIDYQFVDEHFPYIEPAQNATSKINTYQLVNARLTLADIPVAEGQTLKVSLWGKNLTDKEYRVNTIPFGAWTSSFYGDPRTYGLEATYQF